MKMPGIAAVFLYLFMVFVTACQVPPPLPFGPVPTVEQVTWQQMETNMFVHFGPNTFTESEWGEGTESVDLFRPTALDCRQWAAIASDAGMRGIIITAKHHDGFCLWPNPASCHTVAQGMWQDGKGDVLRELSEACREAGLKFGIYISPWDRSDPTYGTEKYNEIFAATLRSALGNYGEVFEQWFDGACGEGPNGKRQIYDWSRYHETVHACQPEAVIFSDVGPGCRWVGNEEGSAGRTCWSRLDTAGFAPGQPPSLDTLNCGNMFGEVWVPAETDVSIRPGWFYHSSEDNQVKSLAELLAIYYNSVGRNSLLLLNVPADKRGLIPAVDSLRLREFRAALDTIFAADLAQGAYIEASDVRSRNCKAENLLDGDYNSYWAASDGICSAMITLRFPESRTFNRVQIQEYIPLGQRIASFHLEVLNDDGTWCRVADETTVGYKRIVCIDRVTTRGLRLAIDRSLASPVLNELALYDDRVFIEAPKARRDKQGCITLTSSEPGDIYYTLDGTLPTTSSMRYTAPFTVVGPCRLASMLVAKERTSAVARVNWDVSPCEFRVVTPATAVAAVDGMSDCGDEAFTHGALLGSEEALVIDLGHVLPLTGFFYEPLAKGREGCLIDYDLAVGPDGKNWTALLKEASFDNIVNNPIRRTVDFGKTVQARYIRLEARRTQFAGHYGIGEFGVLTDRRLIPWEHIKDDVEHRMQQIKNP